MLETYRRGVRLRLLRKLDGKIYIARHGMEDARDICADRFVKDREDLVINFGQQRILFLLVWNRTLPAASLSEVSVSKQGTHRYPENDTSLLVMPFSFSHPFIRRRQDEGQSRPT